MVRQDSQVPGEFGEAGCLSPGRLAIDAEQQALR